MLYEEAIPSQVFDASATIHHEQSLMVLGSAEVGGGSNWAALRRKSFARAEESSRDFIMKDCRLFVG
jgi:hypothetical protein